MTEWLYIYMYLLKWNDTPEIARCIAFNYLLLKHKNFNLTKTTYLVGKFLKSSQTILNKYNHYYESHYLLGLGLVNGMCINLYYSWYDFLF